MALRGENRTGESTRDHVGVDITGDKAGTALLEPVEDGHHTRWLGRTYLAKLYKKLGYQWIPVGGGTVWLVLGTPLE